MFKLLALVVVFASVCNGERNAKCQSRNGYFPVEGSCDAYIECKDYTPYELLCPDGLHYNPAARWPSYPCGYPMDVPCTGRGEPRKPSKPTAECPRQYGFFPSPQASASNCGQYRMCSEGRSIDMTCPPGLAFNPESAQCDWPDLVKSCDPESFLGFKCPPAPLDEDGQPIDAVFNYRFEGDCYAFFSCHKERARLLACDAGFAFDDETGRCEDADKVKCPR